MLVWNLAEGSGSSDGGGGGGGERPPSFTPAPAASFVSSASASTQKGRGGVTLLSADQQGVPAGVISVQI